MACISTKIATPFLEVESGFKMCIIIVGIVLDNCVYDAASTVGFSPAFLSLTND